MIEQFLKKMKEMKNKKLIFFVIIQTFFISTMVLNYLPNISNTYWINKYENSMISSSTWNKNGNAICTATDTQDLHQICSDGAGGAIIVWRDRRNYASTHEDIYAQKINSNGTIDWTTNGVPVCTAGGTQRYPQICSDGAGGAIITWEDGRVPSDYDIYAQRINSSGGVEWTPNGTAICSAANTQSNSQICSDGAEGAIITWMDARPGSNNYDIYAQRVNSSGDDEWTTDGVLICNAAMAQQLLQIVNYTVGGAIIAWHDERTYATTSVDIYAQKINSSGIVEWAPNGVAVSTELTWQDSPQICSDGTGGAIIVWVNDVIGIRDIYAQRVNTTGGMEWTGNGTAVCTENQQQYNPQICSDGAGGAIITWDDYRNNATTDFDIYAQKVNTSGGMEWMANGTAICTASKEQRDPQICSDDAGGAIITWYDNRNYYDIYAQKVNSTGSVQWTLNGRAICTAREDQGPPQICSDGSGGAIITWYDYRNGNYDIYAKHTNITQEKAPELSFLPILMLQQPGPFDQLLIPLILIGIAAAVIVVIVIMKSKK